MSIQRSHSHVTFPCHAPDWGEVRSELEALLLVKDVNELVQKLNRIHHLSQVRKNKNFHVALCYDEAFPCIIIPRSVQPK